MISPSSQDSELEDVWREVAVSAEGKGAVCHAVILGYEFPCATVEPVGSSS